jgi:phage terminase large subunit GpA-like protein
VPEGVIVLTCGVDVQKDRFVYEVVGWNADRESWSIDWGELHGDTALDSTWSLLDDKLLARAFLGAGGAQHTIAMLAIDSSAFTQPVYDWARRHPMSRVIAIKGVGGARALVGAASPVEINFRGKRLQRGYRVWPVGVDVAKSELYGWLQMPRGDGDPPPGWCHFPQDYDEEFFKQLTAEHLVPVVNRRTNRRTSEWQVIPNRENHVLDCRVYARVAAAVLGIDRMGRDKRGRRPPPVPAPAGPAAPSPPAASPAESSSPAAAPPRTPKPAAAPRQGFWAGRPRGGSGGGGWFGRRR